MRLSLEQPARFLERPDLTYRAQNAVDVAGVDRLRVTAAALVEALGSMLTEGLTPCPHSAAGSWQLDWHCIGPMTSQSATCCYAGRRCGP